MARPRKPEGEVTLPKVFVRQVEPDALALVGEDEAEIMRLYYYRGNPDARSVTLNRLLGEVPEGHEIVDESVPQEHYDNWRDDPAI